VGFVVAERILYIPSMGFCLLVSYGWTRLYSSNKYVSLEDFSSSFLRMASREGLFFLSGRGGSGAGCFWPVS
jgi:hypothetical protein